MDDELPDDAENQELVGAWRLWQRKKGHRTSTDDVVTAARAVVLVGETPTRAYLDLGCGVGSVLLLAAHTLRPERSVGVEAQPPSVAMARRSVRELPEAPPIAIVLGDLRAATLGAFDLITGSPPYFPVGTGLLSDDPQRAACRFELRGGVEAYALAASKHLADGGRFVMVAQTLLEPRVIAGAKNADLSVRSALDLRMREDRAEPFLTVYELRRDAGSCVREGCAIRAADNTITPAYAALRARIGLRSG